MKKYDTFSSEGEPSTNVRKIFILPNLFTAGSLFSGMLAIFEILRLEGDPGRACWLIILSALLDVSDGAIARLTKSTSSFGLYLDSLADVVAFGVAPALLAYVAMGAEETRLAPTVCGLYVVCGGLRLARFNVQATREERKSFRGLPIPAAALAVISLVWVWMLRFQGAISGDLLTKVLSPVMVIIAYLMVSRVTYAGFKSLYIAGRQPFEILVTIVVIAFLIYLLNQHLDIVLAVGSWTYLLGGVANHLIRRPLSQWLTGDESPELEESPDAGPGE